ncbi:MAG TPA: CoB--CoM heterodisulfide reductase subunit B, partial [Candidatus Bathyarchaeota archaeon]|nr:CoB--CoM heterodisulfide reductase subunit B [Candidatus Bathyarchaeota archaeon]
MREYLIFLGCVIPYRLQSYEISARRILEAFDVKLVEMLSFNCCGFPVDPINHELASSLAARNICLAEELEMDILTLCNGCFSMLNKTNRMLKEDGGYREKINKTLGEIGMEFKGSIEVKHLVHVLIEDVGIEEIKKTIKRPLRNIQVAQHSGCHLIRPAKYASRGGRGGMEMLKDLIRATGAECLEYEDEDECCGNPIIGVNEEIPLQLAREKLEHVRAAGAQALITVCPFCHIMYDLNQPRI